MHAKNLANACHSYTGAFRSGSGAKDTILSAINRAPTVCHQRLYDWTTSCARNGPIATASFAKNGRRNQQSEWHFESSVGFDFETAGHDRVGMIFPISDTTLTAATNNTTTTNIHNCIISIMKNIVTLPSSLSSPGCGCSVQCCPPS